MERGGEKVRQRVLKQKKRKKSKQKRIKGHQMKK